MVNHSVHSSLDSARIGLIGAGAIGSLLAAGMLALGRSFSWVVRSHDRREQLQRLVLRSAKDERQFDLNGVEMIHSAAELPELDWLLLAVKAQHVDPLLAHLPLHPKRGRLVVANGLQQGPFLLGLLYGGARLLPDGSVMAAPGKQLELGALGFEDSGESSQEACALFAPEILSCTHCTHIELRMWHKLALNCVVNPLSALHDCLNGQLLETTVPDDIMPILDEVSEVAVEELCRSPRFALHRCRAEIARALAPQKLYSDCLALIRSTAGNSSSMREDILHHRETEIEALNMAVVRAGDRLGINCPANRNLTVRIQNLANTRH